MSCSDMGERQPHFLAESALSCCRGEWVRNSPNVAGILCSSEYSIIEISKSRGKKNAFEDFEVSAIPG